MLNKLKLLPFLLIFLCIGCLQKTPVSNIDLKAIEEQEAKKNKPFTGLKGFSDRTDTTVTLVWDNTPLATGYIIYDSTNAAAPIVAAIVAAPANNFKLTGLNPSTVYTFGVRATFDNESFTDDNLILHSIMTNNEPEIPTALTIASPSYTKGLDDDPIIRVHGVKENDLVKIYSESTCTNLVASGYVPVGKQQVDIQVFNLPLGAYEFYATSENSGGNASSCSSIATLYEVDECPNNYVKMDANVVHGLAADFCVAKYEMKCGDTEGLTCAGQTPQSKPEGRPWRNITHAEAIMACSALGAQYELMSNDHWMALAHEIESITINWSNGVPGVNESLNVGHSFNNPIEYLAANSSDDVPCTGITGITTAECSSTIWNKKRRTHQLASGDWIWDLSGNAWEWVNFSISNDKPNDNFTWIDINQVTSTVTLPDIKLKPVDNSLTAISNGIGTYFANNDGVGASLRRGGNKDHGISSGIFTAVLKDDSNVQSPDIGFRCIYTIP